MEQHYMDYEQKLQEFRRLQVSYAARLSRLQQQRDELQEMITNIKREAYEKWGRRFSYFRPFSYTTEQKN